jgi:hypothetical protein
MIFWYLKNRDIYQLRIRRNVTSIPVGGMKTAKQGPSSASNSCSQSKFLNDHGTPLVYTRDQIYKAPG